MSVAVTKPAIEDAIKQILKQNIEKAVQEAIEKAKKEVETKMRQELAGLTLTVLRQYTVETHGESLVIRVENRL